MGKFRAVKIIHHIVDRLDFLFLAEFFHFCGLYVGEEILGSGQFDPLQELEERCFDAFICVSSGDILDRSLQYDKSQLERLHAESNFVYWRGVRNAALGKDRNRKIRELQDYQQTKLLLECVMRIMKKMQVPMDVKSWRHLIRIYVTNHLMLHSSSLQYYPKRKSVAVEEAGKGMMAAYQQLCEQGALPDSEIGDYAGYARLWCAVKVNEAYEYQDMALYFEPQKLAEECEILVARYPDLSNGYVLIGLCYEHSSDKANEAVDAFRQALRMERGHCYSASIYYWIGKRFEAYEAGQEEAEKNYRSAYDKRKKFRNNYKLAMYAGERGQYEQAEDYYLEIIAALKNKKESHMQDPLELEYAFKAYHHMCMLYHKQCDDITVKYKKVISYAQRAIAVTEEDIDASFMYEELYGKQRAEIYRKISKERMSLKNIYRTLSSVYSELHEEELAQKYRGKM